MLPKTAVAERPPDSAPAPPARRKLSYTAFLEWADEEVWAEWVDGEIVPLPLPSILHQRLLRFLSSLIQMFAEAHDRGEALPAPCQMKMAPHLPGRQPDVLFVSQAHRARLRMNHLEGPADLVVEIISPDDPARDRVEKFQEYQEGGVLEYWLIDPLHQLADFYTLSPDGAFHRITPGEDQIFRSIVLDGLWIDLGWLWRDPLPSVLDVARTWSLI